VRDDDGNLVLVLVLVVVLALLMGIIVAALTPSFATARSSTAGEQAVAQANTGLSDALFHLDQIGDNVASFCAGTPPASVWPSSTPCFITGNAPVASAPGVQYYTATTVTNTLATGVIDEMKITSHAVVRGQTRTVTALTYRVSDNFGMYGVSGVNANGSLANATVYEVGGYPVTSALANGAVDLGVGPYGTAVCTGSTGSTEIVTLGQSGSTNSSSSPCPNFSAEPTNLNPKAPAVCTTGQVPTAFTPCIDISGGFATSTVKGTTSTYCPLYGTNIPNSLDTTGTLSPAPASGAVFDCRTIKNSNAALDQTGSVVPQVGSTTQESSSPSCPGLGVFGLSAIPAGSYLFDANHFILGDLDQCQFAGPVNIYEIPDYCSANSAHCPVYQPTATSNTVSTSGNCSANGAGDGTALTLLGSNNNGGGKSNDTNADPAAASPFDFTPGNPSNLNVFWAGDTAINVTTGLVFDGNLYAPAATLTVGNGLETFGSMTLNCFAQTGSPNLYFVYPQHARSYLQNWTETGYSITS
jgi:hypothetical protein